MNIGNIIGKRRGRTPKGTSYEILVTDHDTGEVFERGVYVELSGEIQRAQFTSVEYISLANRQQHLKATTAMMTGDEGRLALRLDAGVIALAEDEADWVRAQSKRLIERFRSETEQETGITYYTLAARVPLGDWKKIAHLFRENVELDCPASSDWNNSINLKWATRRPAEVAAILGWEFTG